MVGVAPGSSGLGVNYRGLESHLSPLLGARNHQHLRRATCPVFSCVREGNSKFDLIRESFCVVDFIIYIAFICTNTKKQKLRRLVH